MCISPCVIAMDVSCVAVADSSCVGGGEVWVPQQVADSPPKRGRLSVKGPIPSVFYCRLRLPFFTPAGTATLPLCGMMSMKLFLKMHACHRRRYRLVYNRFQFWWHRSDLVWEDVEDCPCTRELWDLGRKEYDSLSQRQKNLLLRNFLHRAGAPRWVWQVLVRQWPCDADDRQPTCV